MTERFQSSDAIVGQFLPKIYTRRITLEDTKMPTRFPPRNPENAPPERLFRPGTAITVDYHIKDVLSPEGIGVITNNQNQDEDPNQIQDEILSSLKVAIFLFSDNAVFETLMSTVRSFNAFGWRTNLPSVMPSFENYLLQTVESLNRRGEKVILQINDARPDTIGFEVRNSQYQEYDVNNNLINVIPYEHTFKVENLYFGMCDNLSLMCFTYFDFSSLSLDEMSNEEVKRLGYMTGDITADVITRGARIESTATVYKDAETKVPYYGPVHSMGTDQLMTGLTHREDSRALTTHQVPLTKIQDFRAMERLKETNYQPPALQTFDSSIPSLDLIEKNYKDFFNTRDVVVDFDRVNEVANIEFTIDMSSIYKRTRYYDLVKSNPSSILFGYPALMDILEITVLRRRVTKRPIGHNKVGGHTRVPFDQVEEEMHIVATSGQNESASGGVEARNVFTKEDMDSKIMELTVPGFAGMIFRKFFIEDRQVADYLGTGATFQYGVELRIKDPTKDRFIALLSAARSNLRNLNRYLQEASIPVFDSRMIIKQDSSRPISLDDVRDPPQYGEVVQQGNYNTVSKLLVTDFVRQARRRYDLRGYVNNYLELVDVAFAKSEVSMYHFSNPTQGNDGERGIVNEGNSAGINARPKDLLMSTESLTMEGAFNALYNMINPSNARPETIQSFIKTYQDLVMDLEDYFDIGADKHLTTEGSGYRARGDNTLHMQRWFSNVEENPDGSAIDSDNYIEMDPLERVFFRYWGTADRINGEGIPKVTAETYQDRLDREREKYFPDAAVDFVMSKITPISIIIGTDEIFFDEQEMERERTARDAQERIEHMRAEKQRKAYFEAKRKGRATKKPRFKRKKKKRRHVLAKPEEGKLISNFVEEIYFYQRRYGNQSPNPIIGAMNSTEHYGVEISGQPSFERYFNFMSSITEEMADAAFQYSNSIEELQNANRSLPNIDVEEYVSSNVSCGLIDNRPAGNKIIDETNRFNREEGLYPGLFNFIQQIPPPPIQDVPQIPQIASSNFPLGRQFAASARSFPNARASLPTSLPDPTPPASGTSTSQPRRESAVPSRPGVGAIEVQTTPRQRPTPPTTRATRALETTQTATTAAVMRSSTGRRTVTVAGGSNNRARQATARATTFRATTPRTTSPARGPGGMGMGMGGMSGPRRGGYGY